MASKNHPGISSGRTVKARDLQYIQRPADAALLDHCRNGRPAYILHSPQMGKSSLIAHTAEQLNAKSHHAVLIDLSQFSLPPREEEWFHNIVRILDDSLDLSTDVMSWWGKPAVFALPPYIRLTKLITEVILPEITKPLVLFIDEIERTMILPFREHFFEWLTTLYESRATDSILYRLSFVVCGVATPSQLIPEGGPLLFQWSHRVVLSDFTLQEALPLAEGLSLPTDAANEAVTWVYRWTKGHPYLTQLLCQLLEEQHRMAWLETEVDECIRHFIVSPQGLREPNFQFVRRALTEPDVNGASLLEPYLELLEGKTENLKTNPVALEQLRLVGVLREDDEEIAIRNILYQEAFPIEWVKRHLRPPTSAPQTVVSPLPATQHSYVMAASLFLLGVGLLVWFFGTPVSVPLSVTSQQAPSVSIESPATPSALTEITNTPQQPEALAQAQEKIQELEATIARYQQLSTGEVESLIDQRTQLETELAAKEDKLSNLQDQVQTMETTLVDQRDAHEQMIADLQTERTKLQSQATTTTRELNTAIENVKTLQTAVLKKSSLPPSEINKLMANRSQLETQLKTANTELALAHERARGLEARLTQQQQLMQTEKQRLVEGRSRQETKLKGLEIALADTRQMLSKKEATAQEQAELARSELNRLQQDRTKYQELLSTGQQELSSLKNRTVNLEATLAKKDQAIQEEKQERDRLKTELSQAGQELNSAKTQVATLGDQLSAALAQVALNQNALKEIHTSSSEQTRRSEEQAAELASARSGLQARLQESQTALTQAQEQIKQLEKNSAKISETQDTLRKTTEERDQYSQKLQVKEQLLAKAQDNIQRLEQSLLAVTSTAKSGGTEATLSSTSVKSLQANSPQEEEIVKTVSRISAKLTQSPSPIQSETAKLLWARQAYLLNLRTQGTQWNTIDRSLRDGLHTSPIRLKGASSKILTLTFDPSGDHVIAGTSDGKMFLWSMSNPSDSPRIFSGHTAGVLSATVSPNGQQIASGSLDSTIRLWDLAQPTTQPRILQAHKKGATSLAFRPDGKQLASGSQDHTILLWDLTSDQPRADRLGAHAGRVNAIAYTPDGKTLISGGDDLALRVWDLQRMDSPPKILRGHQQGISTVAIHSSGWMVATGSRDRQIGLWNLRQSTIAPTFLTGSEGRISQVQFSTDGTSVASVSSDKSLRIWNWHEPTQTPIQFPKHKGTLEALAISPDGRTIAVGGSGQSVTLWSGTGQLAHAVCDTAKENLPFAEWKKIVGEEVPYERTCPNLPLHPSFLEEGKRLAKQGSRDEAQTIFQRAKQLDPYLKLDPKKEVERLSARSS
ncbi:MAG: AAA-like domain-containing protein [Nitrospirales bacterium]